MNSCDRKRLGGTASGPDAIRYACDEFVVGSDSRERWRSLLSLGKYIAARIEFATFAIHLVMSLVLGAC